MEFMMTSSNGNIFRVTGSLCGEFTGDRWIPRTMASGAELWCFLWSAPWKNGWVNNREAGDLRRHCAHYDVIVISHTDKMASFHWARDQDSQLSLFRRCGWKRYYFHRFQMAVPVLIHIMYTYIQKFDSGYNCAVRFKLIVSIVYERNVLGECIVLHRVWTCQIFVIWLICNGNSADINVVYFTSNLV